MAPSEADTVVQEALSEAGHATDYGDIEKWGVEENTSFEGVVRVDGFAVNMGLDFSDEVRDECRRWVEREEAAGTLSRDPITGWVCTDGSAIDGNGQVLTRAGASVVQLSGAAQAEAVLGWEERPSTNP